MTQTPDTPTHELADLFPPGTPRHPVAAALMLSVGLLLIVVAAALGFVPGLAGFPLAIIGLVLAAKASDRARRRLNAWDARLPLRWRVRLRCWMRKLHPRAGDGATAP